MSLVQEFAAYGNWRTRLGNDLQHLADWLSDNALGDTHSRDKLLELRLRLDADRLTVAFVAEFSRGKSELINALFFAEYGKRIVPSAAGRTTMCPTELAYDPRYPAAMDLLPIETRASAVPVSELKLHPEAWQRVPLDTSSADAMSETLRQIGLQTRVTAAAARALGFSVGADAGAEELFAIPRWRHASINFPHPLLEQGLVILDTPGLNALGVEPELTLCLLPGADAIVFVLAADAGVTLSDLGIWRDHLGTTHRDGASLVVLNKIDGLWDGLRPDSEVNAEIALQVGACADALGISRTRVLPVSAQKGLVAKIHKDLLLLERSRLPLLEHAIAQQLIAARQTIIGTHVVAEAKTICALAREQLCSRLSAISAQLGELRKLRGKNQKAIQYVLGKVNLERAALDEGLQHYHAVRAVFAQIGNKLLAELGMDKLRTETRRTREAMRSAAFSKGLSDAMKSYFAAIRPHFSVAAAHGREITDMLAAMHRRFNLELDLRLEAPRPYTQSQHEEDIDLLEQRFDGHINTLLNLLTREKHTLSQQFFETVAVRLRRIFEAANRDAQRWLRHVMAPLETQVREAQTQMQRRLESIQLIHQAVETLEQRIAELGQNETTLRAQLAELAHLEAALPGSNGTAAGALKVAA